MRGRKKHESELIMTMTTPSMPEIRMRRYIIRWKSMKDFRPGRESVHQWMASSYSVNRGPWTDPKDDLINSIVSRVSEVFEQDHEEWMEQALFNRMDDPDPRQFEDETAEIYSDSLQIIRVVPVDWDYTPPAGDAGRNHSLWQDEDDWFDAIAPVTDVIRNEVRKRWEKSGNSTSS